MKIRSLLSTLGVVALCFSVSACGEQSADSLAREPGPAPATTAGGTYGLPDAEQALRDGGLDLLRRGSGSALDGGLDPKPRTSQTYTVQDNSQLDLLVFSTPDDAKRAVSAVADDKIVKDGGESARAGNLVLVISGGLNDRTSYKAAFEVFGRLANRT